jgi:dephospho-CoA kinase
MNTANPLSSIYKIALTGGIGSGKSAAAQQFEKYGIPVIDSDAIAHNITAPHGEGIPEILQTFGSEYINDDGSLNRSKMRALVFNNPEALRKLERITHPLIRASGEKAALEAAQNNPPYILFMIPLLFESNSWQGKYQKIVVVDCSVEEQIRRVELRNGLDRSEIEKIIKAQVPRDTRLSNADYIIDNSGSMEHLIEQVELTHRLIIKFLSNIRL